MHFQLPFENAIDDDLVAELEKGAVYASAAMQRFRLCQRSRGLKYEMLVDVGADAGPVAAGSINLAGTLFGQAFRIRTHAGEAATTACVGFGLGRLVLALFSQHGFEPQRWPCAVREVVFG
jgi:hypothetical protein